MKTSRRDFIRKVGYASAGAFLVPGFVKAMNSMGNEELFFDISLAQWSLHRSFFGEETMNMGWNNFGRMLNSEEYPKLLAGELNPLHFPTIAKEKYDINAVEYVNTFYFDKAEDQAYLRELKSRADSAGVQNLIIMCDALGNLGDTDDENRKQAVENHYKWVDAASFLGCHSIRVNAAGEGSAEEVAEAATDGLSRLAEYASESDINVIVENHGGYSSDAEWLVNVIENTGRENCGTLPDFGNFTISEGNTYDKYKGIRELMPYAKGVSAKSHEFNEEGYEKNIDFAKMLKIVKDAGFTGYIGIEYEGDGLSEHEGIIATKELLIKVGKELTK